MYRSLARWCYRRAWLVLALWLLAMVGINVLGGAVGSRYDTGFSAPDSESSRGFTTIAEFFPGAASEVGGSIVFSTAAGIDDPGVVTAMTTMFAAVNEIDGVTVVSPYDDLAASQVAPDRTVAFAQVNLDPDIDQVEASALGTEIAALTPSVVGLRVEIGGTALAEFEPPETELIGVAFAIVILILAFGSVLAMGLPIGVAVAGVVTGGVGLVSLLSHAMTIPEFSTFIAIMIGLGIGIDYALFIVTRYRELTRAGSSPADAVVGAMDTAGRAVLVAGVTVVLSLLGMLLIGMPFVTGLGVAAACTVAITVAASLTLLPALLSLLHSRLEVTRWRGLVGAGFAAIALLGLGLSLPVLAATGAVLMATTFVASLALRPLRMVVPHRHHKPLRQTIAYRWSRVIQDRPWTGVLVGGGLLLLLTVPTFGLRLGFSDEGNYAEHTTTRQAYDLVAEGFGPGFNGPLVVAVRATDSGSDAGAAVAAIAATVADDAGVATVSAPIANDPAAPDAYLLQVIPTTAPQDEATDDTVLRLRERIAAVTADGGVVADVTGTAAANIDISRYLASRLLVFFAAVLAVSFVLLMVVFRSLLVPLKAVIMNMLSISAAYGVVVALFQWGWLGGLTGIEPAPIEPFIPMMLFAIVFGLSMDYEVFLLTRMKEEYDRTGDPKNSVADGLAATARVITAAAAIMVVVFGSFLLEEDRVAKLFGFGLALAIFLDATLVRMLLVPATMELLGSRNWWLPRWLDRWLPTLDIEGPAGASLPGDQHEPQREPVSVS
jgi:RND superfamily putative drug exporter